MAGGLCLVAVAAPGRADPPRQEEQECYGADGRAHAGDGGGTHRDGGRGHVDLAVRGRRLDAEQGLAWRPGGHVKVDPVVAGLQRDDLCASAPDLDARCPDPEPDPQSEASWIRIRIFDTDSDPESKN